ncbi:bifunctional P-450:NADPH-P450 reductase [Lophiotrema nucula]|uniref:Bifunctional cytochrome P450/NADPH--P450 reductase n=1 Tax=Lophiotrema nucula TaxID=690887 RepID=A0A6A5YM68_9PLEO|nr:bifunctional P-450:NADPH-P450 reductase [Lophiotrema nucula]
MDPSHLSRTFSEMEPKTHKAVPAPPGLPVIGNLLDLAGSETPIGALEQLAEKWGPIYKLTLGGRERVIIANYALFEEVCDETRFFKVPGAGLDSLQSGSPGPPGLFTAPSEKHPDWGQAHRILVPAFGPLSIRNMFDEMHDIASQLVLKWARKGPSYRIPITEDFTRLTLDTIALCTMDYRFNSFYQDGMHSFVDAMLAVLTDGGARARIPKFMHKFMVMRNKSRQENGKHMVDTAQEVIRHRRENPSGKKDPLDSLINGKDPKTGEGMRDPLIASNLITFLIAGHETTSGLLSFAFHLMLTNPRTYFEAVEEVDRVVGRETLSVDHLKDLKYINAILRETLRLQPTAPLFTRGLREENIEDPFTVGGYALNRDWPIMCLIGKIQRDPQVYGDDANEFRPERMLDEEFDKLPKAAWKPFGTGMRACIGRPFALQEALLVVAILLQNFDFRMDDPSYQLKIKSTLTVKPLDFYVRATLRKGVSTTSLQHSLSASSDQAKSPKPSSSIEQTADERSGRPMKILYGSNTGTCQSFAQKLAADARSHGYHATVNNLDAGVNALSTSQPVVLICSSYEGFPPDNAVQFVAWLESLKAEGALKGVQFGVFGCGHKDWASTYFRVPKLIDETLENLGASRFVERGSSDASQGSMFEDFDTWCDTKLWPALDANFGLGQAMPTKKTTIDMDISTKTRASQLQNDVQQGKVIATKLLTAPGEPEKRHLEVKLPEDTEYAAGDYLAILPLNPDASVHRVLSHFSLPPDAVVTIKAGGPVTLPSNTPVSVSELLKGFVELSLPVTKKHIRNLIEYTTDKSTLEILNALSGDLYQDEVVTKRLSVLDLLEAHNSISLPFSEFLALLPPMRLRHYSISSSPLKDPTTCSITYGVINEQSLSGAGQFQGVTGTYLTSLRAGDAIQVSVRPAPAAFHLPASSATTPILMFCNGTGLAPFRGFIEERAVQLAANPDQKLAHAVLFIGCRSLSKDALYHDELVEWAKAGVVDIRYAFSQDQSHPDADGCKYAQDRMLKDQNVVRSMWEEGAKVYVCGSPGLAEGIKKVSRTLAEQREGATPEKIEEFFKKMRNERIAVDVFA